MSVRVVYTKEVADCMSYNDDEYYFVLQATILPNQTDPSYLYVGGVNSNLGKQNNKFQETESTHSPTHLLTHSPTHLLTHSLTHSLR